MNKILLLVTLAASFSHSKEYPKITTEDYEYKDGKTALQGYLATPVFNSLRPAVIIVHDWMGMSPFAKHRAEELAKLGYVAFAADIYGKSVRPKSAEEAGKVAGIYKGDRKLFRERLTAALNELKKMPNVDQKNIAAMGYCFGGTGALELARSGADIKGIVSFHGSLDTPTPQDAKNIKGKVLVLHGAEDPLVPAKDVEAFENEMRAANVDWELVKYSHAVHAFTNPDADKMGNPAVKYNAEADHRSWIAMQDFFKEIFGSKNN